VQAVRLQREPFEGRGRRAEAFAPGTRFAKERLWHVEVAFTEPVFGPVLLGDGRYLGLGLMRPVRDARREVIAFTLPAEMRVAMAVRKNLLHAIRRALMSLSRDEKGGVPPLFSGHEPDGEKAASGRHRHVFLAGADLDRDGCIEQVIVAAPWVCDRSVQPHGRDAELFDRVVGTLATVRAGRLGVIPLHASTPGRALVGPARIWESHADYSATRHASRGKEPADALLRDVMLECERRRLPKPEIDLLDFSAGPKGGGITARLRLRFKVAVPGPILLGRDSHQGGGLFLAAGYADR
jgi:CRISPR-associated protein Csb2